MRNRQEAPSHQAGVHAGDSKVVDEGPEPGHTQPRLRVPDVDRYGPQLQAGPHRPGQDLGFEVEMRTAQASIAKRTRPDRLESHSGNRLSKRPFRSAARNCRSGSRPGSFGEHWLPVRSLHPITMAVSSSWSRGMNFSRSRGWCWPSASMRDHEAAALGPDVPQGRENRRTLAAVLLVPQDGDVAARQQSFDVRVRAPVIDHHDLRYQGTALHCNGCHRILVVVYRNRAPDVIEASTTTCFHAAYVFPAPFSVSAAPCSRETLRAPSDRGTADRCRDDREEIRSF